MPSLSLEKCFAHYGAKKSNPFSWSARSDKVVVVTMWADRLDESGPVAIYRDVPPGVAQNPGSTRERTKNLIWARDHLDGILRVVVVTAVDPTAQPRRSDKKQVREDLVMKLTHLDPVTGYFEAQAIAVTGAP